MRRRGHWGEYAPGTASDPIRKCLICGKWRRQWWVDPTPLIHNGGRPRRRRN